MNADFVRYIDSIHREKGIEHEVLFRAFEDALVTAIKKRYEIDDDLEIRFDRQSGEMQSNYEINFEDMGRIFAQTVKQTWFTKIKEAERDVQFGEYADQIGEIVTGQIQRFEGDSVLVQLGKMEGLLPRSEKVRGESYHVGERIRAIILDVRKVGLKVKIILSRSAPDLVRRLFELEVPEIADGVIEIVKLEREPGYRTKIAVTSSDARVDCVGACVGVRGTRIKSIIDELGGERIDIIRWNEDPEQMLINALLPAQVSHVQLDQDEKRALVLVEEDQLSLAIGRKGQNVRLASKLCGWDIDIMTRAELEQTLKEDEEGPSTATAEAGAEGDPAGTAAGDGTDGAEASTDGIEAVTGDAGEATGETETTGDEEGGKAADVVVEAPEAAVEAQTEEPPAAGATESDETPSTGSGAGEDTEKPEGGI